MSLRVTDIISWADHAGDWQLAQVWQTAVSEYSLSLKFRDRLDPTCFGNGKSDLIARMQGV